MNNSGDERVTDMPVELAEMYQLVERTLSVTSLYGGVPEKAAELAARMSVVLKDQEHRVVIVALIGMLLDETYEWKKFHAHQERMMES